MRTFGLILGILLAALGYLINLVFFGPLAWVGWVLGTPPLVIGILLILSSSVGAKRMFLKAAAQEKIFLARLRRWIRGRAKKRFAKRQAKALA